MNTPQGPGTPDPADTAPLFSDPVADAAEAHPPTEAPAPYVRDPDAPEDVEGGAPYIDRDVQDEEE